ncbi:MAG: TetR/AcrR family transcriptional regulator, partial [Gammaproteobacteria bacterium]
MTTKGAQAILEAAEALFAERGFDAVSLSDIAQKAGMAKSSILHHFRSKEGLYLAVLKRACERSAWALEGSSLEAFFLGHLKALFAHAATTRLIQRELMERG